MGVWIYVGSRKYIGGALGFKVAGGHDTRLCCCGRVKLWRRVNSREPLSYVGCGRTRHLGKTAAHRLPVLECTESRQRQGSHADSTFSLSSRTGKQRQQLHTRNTRPRNRELSAMYVCRACVRRASISLLRPLPAAQDATSSRTFATTSVLRQRSDSDWLEFEVAARRQLKEMPELDREEWKKGVMEKMRRATKKELEYAKDPYHIADNVLTKLKAGEFEKALLLTREASRGKQCVVSWNHILEYEFKNQKLHSAIKLYNEVSGLSSNSPVPRLT